MASCPLSEASMPARGRGGAGGHEIRPPSEAGRHALAPLCSAGQKRKREPRAWGRAQNLSLRASELEDQLSQDVSVYRQANQGPGREVPRNAGAQPRPPRPFPNRPSQLCLFSLGRVFSLAFPTCPASPSDRQVGGPLGLLQGSTGGGRGLGWALCVPRLPTSSAFTCPPPRAETYAGNLCPHPQVNGVCVEGKPHGEVVSAIKAGGDEAKLLVVDRETDEFFKKCKVIPSQEHLQGELGLAA